MEGKGVLRWISFFLTLGVVREGLFHPLLFFFRGEEKEEVCVSFSPGVLVPFGGKGGGESLVR